MEEGPVLFLDEEGLAFHDLPNGRLQSVRSQCPKCRRLTQVRARQEPPTGMAWVNLSGSQRRLYLRPYCAVCGSRLPSRTVDELDKAQRP